MSRSDYTEVAKYAGSIGLLVDRCSRRDNPFGTVWMVDEDKVATCAHLVVLYADFLRGLKVRFPASNQEWEIVEAQFHPRFDRRVAVEMAQRSLSAPVPALALQDYNLVILRLSRGLTDLGSDESTTFNKKVSLAPLPRMKGLAGAVDDLGLALVVQTVTNARKEGMLIFSDERNRPTAKLFCRDGKIIYAKFGNLSNELAINQMFSQNLGGQFNFRTVSRPDWWVTEPMSRATDGLLLEAHRRMDEEPRKLEQLGGTSSYYVRATELLDESALSEETRPLASRIWPHLDGGVSVDQLWEVVNLDSYSVYSTLVEMLDAKQIAPVQMMDSDGLNPMQPLQIAPHLLLSPWDEIINLSVDPIVGNAQMRKGSLVGLLRPNDPNHLLHTRTLPYRSAGSPLFKNGQVVGMHCGMLPLDPTLHALPHHLHQMLWVEAVQQCLHNPAKPSKTIKKSIGMQRPDPSGSRINCPKCNSSMVKLAKFCGTCGQKL